MNIFTKIKSWFGGGEEEKPRAAAAAAAAAAADLPLEVIEPVRKLQARASELSERLFSSLGYQKLSGFVNEQTADSLLSGTRVTDTGALDFSVAEVRFLKLPEQWLKLVEKSLQQLIDGLEELEAGVPSGELRTTQKAVITVTPEAREMIVSAGMGELVTKGFITGIETELVNKDGKAQPVTVSASALKDEAGNIQGMVIAAKDLTELKRLEVERLHALETAKEQAEMEVAERTRELEHSKVALEQSLATEKATTQQMKASQQQLTASNQQLGAAQKNLQDKLLELERFNKVAVGRELKMVELKEEIARLKGAGIESTKT